MSDSSGPGRDAQGRRHHGRRRRRAGRIAEDAGACAVMALERVPADIRRDGGVARMSDPEMIEGIQKAVSIPVMAKVRIGHFVEAQILEALERRLHRRERGAHPRRRGPPHRQVRLQPCRSCAAATNLGEALRRITRARRMIRTKGEAGTGNIVEAVRHMRARSWRHPRSAQADEAELFEWAKRPAVPLAARAVRSPSTGGCRSPTSPPAASPRRPTPR
jgi:pyridoxal 5'-phosphate synthase pdxS subunit